jgi:hypothetical protein
LLGLDRQIQAKGGDLAIPLEQFWIYRACLVPRYLVDSLLTQEAIMELRQYWRIVYKRLWIVIALVAIVLISSLVFRPGRPSLYQTSLRFTVAVLPESRSDDYYAYDRYYTWMASEYLVDELTEIVGSEAFARAVSKELANSGHDLSAGAIRGSLGADRKHRILTLHLTWGDQTHAS